MSPTTNRRIAIAVAATVIAVGAGAYLYSARSSIVDDLDKASKSKPKKKKKASTTGSSPASSQQLNPEISGLLEKEIKDLSSQDREKVADALKEQGNSLFRRQKFDDAVENYSRSLRYHKTPASLANRAACHTVLKKYELVVIDATEALKLDSNYMKALLRRANAYKELGGESNLQLAVNDLTAAVIIDGFKSEENQKILSATLDSLCALQASQILANRQPRLPSKAFVSAYLNSYHEHGELTVPFPDPIDDAPRAVQTFKLAKDALAATDYAHASTLVSEAIDQGLQEPFLVSALSLRAIMYFLMGAAPLALNDLDRATDLNSNISTLWIEKASVHMEQANPSAAFADYDKAQKIKPSDPDVYYHRGQAYFLQGDLPEAQKMFDKAASLDPEFLFAPIQWAVVTYKLGNIDSANRKLNDLTKRFPDRFEVFNYFGELLIDQQKTKDAIANIDKAIALSKASSEPSALPLVNRALVDIQSSQSENLLPEARLSKLDSAEKYLREALDVDPDCDVGIMTLGQTLLQRNKIPEAMNFFERSLALCRMQSELTAVLQYINASKAQLAFLQDHSNHPAAKIISPDL